MGEILKNIRQTATFQANAHDVYEALMDAKKHSGFTGSKAVISRRVGGRFTTYDGYATGENIELVPDQRIVQTWRGDDWPEGLYSRIMFILEETNGKTQLTFTQTGIPDEQAADITQGWRDYYWKPLKKWLGVKEEE
jgi:activator of HSP90 ATPase